MAYSLFLSKIYLLCVIGFLFILSDASAYERRVPITITNTTATALTNHAVELTLTSTEMPNFNWSNNGEDIAARDSTVTTDIDFWLESIDTVAETLTVWIEVPSIPASASVEINFLYDGPTDPSKSNIANTFAASGFKYHTQPYTGADVFANRANGDAVFNYNSVTTTSGYGCTAVNNLNRDNSGTFGSNNNIAYFSEVFFDLTSAGTYRFRFGGDYGYGGEITIDGTAYTTTRGGLNSWTTDIWWGLSYANSDVIRTPAISLSAGVHHFDTLGFEACCDGTFGLQYRRTDGGAPSSWTNFDVNAPGVTLYAPSCPLTTHSVGSEMLPVSLASFASRITGDHLMLSWSTSSETFNFGFNVWGDIDGQWQRLNQQVIPSRGVDSLETQSYQKRLSVSAFSADVTRVALSSVELNGREEFYGPYQVGEKVGEDRMLEPIDWQQVAKEAAPSLAALGYRQRGRNWVKERRAQRSPLARVQVGLNVASTQSLSGNRVLAEFRSTAVGIHRVTHAALVSVGVNLISMQVETLALTYHGEAQARYIHSARGIWRTDSYIDFYSAGVSDEIRLHTNESVFRLEYDVSQGSVLSAGVVDRAVETPSNTHAALAIRNEQVTYDFTMPPPDPWYEQYLVLIPNSEDRDRSSHTFRLRTNHVDKTGADAEVVARVITLTDFGAGIDHRLELIHVDGTGTETVLAVEESDGYATVELAGRIGASALAASDQFRVQQQLIDTDPDTGQRPEHWLGAAAYFDQADVAYTAANIVRDDVLHWSRDQARTSVEYDGYTVSGLSRATAISYAYHHGSLWRLEPIQAIQNGLDHRWSVTIPAVHQVDSTYWVSTEDALYKPVLAVPSLEIAGLETENRDYLIIAHPMFIDRLIHPDPDALDFVKHKESHGHRVKVVDAEQVAQVYGHGHRIPEAITAYLTQERQHNPNLNYVLLIGNASRDPNDYTGYGSWNLIPTYYDVTHPILHYAPNDGRLADLDHDGYQDLAIGRWPVRQMSELNTIIAKTIAYTDGTIATPATQTLQTAVLAADRFDHRNDFSAQMDLIDTQLTQSDFHTTKIYQDEGYTSEDLIEAINAGQSVTSYSGHAGPTQWSFHGLLHYNHVTQLTNTNHPTLMLPLSCYTTYTVSEHTDTLGQKLMSHSGGAVAIVGAASLSSYGANQTLITDIIQRMTTGIDTDGDGDPDTPLSLGEALTRAKKATAKADHSVNISGNLLGDPSLYIVK